MTREQYFIYFCIFIIILSTGVLYFDFAGGSTNEQTADTTLQQQSQLPFSERTQLIQPNENVTVISDHPGDRLIAFAPDGRLLYYTDTFDRYYDVDPVSNGSNTVEVVGVEYLDLDTTRQFVQRINLTTGHSEMKYTHIVPRTGGPHRWHDVDRLGPDRLVVADIYRDSVFIVNTTTEERVYEWHVQDDYPLDGGGPWPSDWTHLNDVEALADGRIMVSLRNQDQVIFIRPGKGLIEDWTLGAEDNYTTLYEQHNPDYIPEEQGGPAIIVADSQNNRVVEYQRTDGSWQQSWQWSDAEMQWPRDADRLPNGHTLIADSNSGRILEINKSGDIVWQITGVSNYEAERLGTGDESSGGSSAATLNLISQGQRSEQSSRVQSIVTEIKKFLRSLLPAKVINAALIVLPSWMSPQSVGAVISIILTSGILIGLSLKRSRYRFQTPIIREDD
ncbi:MAG: arylsulfotransferase (ASST) [Haloquadratum walsbyi J07HQW1]|uniref:Arylsulfotransferase (ASST) n=1 Tax=Haloquadratum walsbyi J07HQW1 TaxID=1238424 RepID=U1N7G2_9EURY|nr:MAG: arylsulfotransferase (ASST) [Haloquadratum walsbyi J07HQW1]